MQYSLPVLLIICFFISQVSAQDADTRNIGVEVVDVRHINTSPDAVSGDFASLTHTRGLHTTTSKKQSQTKYLLANVLSRQEQNKVRRVCELNLWGKEFTFFYDPDIRFNLKEDLNKKVIRTYWDQLEKASHHLITKQLNFLSNYLQLNDWGYCMLVNELAQAIYPYDQNAQKIFEVFMLGKVGIESRLSYDEKRVYALFTSKQRIYGASIDTLRSGNKWRKFYAIDFGKELPDVKQAFNLGIRDIPYPYPSHKANGIDLKTQHIPNFQHIPVVREYTFQFEGTRYNLKAELNQHLLDYYSTVPFTGPKLNFHAPLSQSAGYTLIPQLEHIVKDMPEERAVNLILRFVQAGLTYRKDSDQFGRETYLVPEQTLAATASDCEDRCFLFSYLIREILGLEAVGLQYEGHMAVGVRLTQDTPATYIPYQNVNYYICDPTMVGANIGQTLPEYTGKRAKLIFSE